MIYDVRAHPLLSVDAKGLGNEALRQHIELAEELLGLDKVAVVTEEGATLDRIKRAIVLQVNWQILLDPDALMLKSKTAGIESETYRDDLTLTYAEATALVSSIVGTVEEEASGTWEPIVSKRG